ncbi:MAG: hypothetical protein JJ866_05075 [Roseibium sp.]|nr:hypothetical protein [Roseibium sp.]MBO6511543.1 hypothetical protein [Roseibium sp.]MBO6891296.1 hypothetical protein [Roseibium sp.]MBO6931613.1 hypothetical protein [Roseibium sp.]
MLNIYAQSFLEASRFTPHTRPAPATEVELENRSRRRWFRIPGRKTR